MYDNKHYTHNLSQYTHCLILLIHFYKDSLVNSAVVDSSWNVMAHGDAREGNWRETGEWSG